MPDAPAGSAATVGIDPEGHAGFASQRQVDAAPRAHALRWSGDLFAVTPLGPEEAAARALSAPHRCRTYMDCGVWQGDGDDAPVRRTFGVVCGRTTALCEFQNVGGLEDVSGPIDESVPINKLLRALAGPQRLDVAVLRVLRAPAPMGERDEDAGARRGRRVHVFLPDMHIPLVPQMPELRPSLIPDPTKATCFCHGPVMQRILYGERPTAQYSAVGCTLTRDPNQWFYMMSERHRPIAEDLLKFLARLTRYRAAAPVHLVQLGALFELWAGFELRFHATGRSAFIAPRIARAAHLTVLARDWPERLVQSPARDALASIARFPAADRTLLSDDPVTFAQLPEDDARGLLERAKLVAPGLFVAEHRPTAYEPSVDRPPMGFMALLEQQARMQPWMRALPKGWRHLFMAYAVEAVTAMSEAEDAAVYVMAHTHVPCLTQVFF